MSLNLDNKTRLDKYIKENPNCEQKQFFPITLKGQKKLLKVYKLLIAYLFYNIRNGRFAAEYIELAKREGGDLQPEKPEDAIKIKRMLLDLDPIETKRTYDDIKIRGQWNCGVITEDGYVVDGNRRMSIISELYADTGQEEWKYLLVARLDEPISAEDLWKLEAGAQLGKDEIVRYGPVNELLKLKEGIDAGLSKKEIVKTLYGYEKEEEIDEKLDRLDLIEQYLKFFGILKKYSKVKNRVEHFINLQNILVECREQQYDPELIQKIKYCVFQLINEGIPHLEIRKIRQMIEDDVKEGISEIETAGSQIKPTKPKTDDGIIEEVKSAIDEYEEDDDLSSATKTHFINATDFLDVKRNEGKELLLLSRAEKNLKPLVNLKEIDFSKDEYSNLIEKIFNYASKLKQKSNKE